MHDQITIKMKSNQTGWLRLFLNNTRTFAYSNCDLKFKEEDIWYSDLCLDQSKHLEFGFDQINLNPFVNMKETIYAIEL